jgi:hypothetical protein
MSWAAYRHATRIEDRAYSLLGIFDVQIPMIYGEGGKAFARLQEQIIQASTDHTIFCWNAPLESNDGIGGCLHNRLHNSLGAMTLIRSLSDRPGRTR